MADGSGFTPTFYAIIIAIIGGAGTLFKVWPLLKARLNELKKIELDDAADFRGDLLERIKLLEAARDGEPERINAAILLERTRCDAELANQRLDFQKKIDGLERTISQNSDSASQLLDLSGRLGKPKKGAHE